MINGIGVLIWQLAKMPAPDALAKLVSDAKLDWVSIKTLDGTQLYNAKGGNQKTLKAYWAALKEVCSVGAWHRVYGDQPGAEGDAAEAFYEEFKPDHFLIDAEGEYKRYGAAGRAKIYCGKLHDGQVDTYLCSYRFPSMHGGLKPFPFQAFLNSDKVDGTAPQVYWIGSHDPVDQLARSLKEYRAITNKRFVPIGSAFGEAGWEPTVVDIRSFVKAAWPNFGFYSLDYILTHNHMDWLQAMTGITPPPPPPPPLDDHTRLDILWNKAIEEGWELPVS